jgi:TRAP-type C4-dicarboxylate transport system permease small subunit
LGVGSATAPYASRVARGLPDTHLLPKTMGEGEWLMKLLTRLTAVFDKAVSVLAILGGVLLVLAMIAINYGVILRYFFRAPQAWVPEITSMSLVYITFLATTWVLRKDGHVIMDFVALMLKPGSKKILDAVTSFICSIMFLLFVVYGAYVTWDHYIRGLYNANEVLRIPTAYALAIIPVGSFFLFVQLIRRSLSHFSVRKKIESQ